MRVSEHDRQTNDTQTGKQANKAKAKTTNKWPKFAHGNGRAKTKEEREEDVDEGLEQGQGQEQALKKQQHFGQRAKDTWGAHDGTI